MHEGRLALTELVLVMFKTSVLKTETLLARCANCVLLLTCVKPAHWNMFTSHTHTIKKQNESCEKTCLCVN